MLQGGVDDKQAAAKQPHHLLMTLHNLTYLFKLLRHKLKRTSYSDRGTLRRWCSHTPGATNSVTSPASVILLFSLRRHSDLFDKLVTKIPVQCVVAAILQVQLPSLYAPVLSWSCLLYIASHAWHAA